MNVLTDAEWMSLIDGTRDDPNSLQKCCANISDLRDQIITMAREGGELNLWGQFFLRSYRAARNGHDEIDRITALVKLRDACLAAGNITLTDLMCESHADRSFIEG